MANTLTGLIQYIYDSVDVVSRELVGLIPAVYKNSKADQAAKNQDITYDVVPAATGYDITPSNAIPALDSTTVGTGTMKINKVRGVKFHWTGEDELAIGREAKDGIENNKFAQAFRALANEMESDLGNLYKSASRAVAPAGTNLFDSAGDFSDAANVVKILKDNGAPLSDLQLVVNTAAGARIIGKQSQAHIIGTDSQQRSGLILPIAGCTIRESAEIKTHTKGTGANYVTNGGEPLGETEIAADGGTGTIVAGDVVTIADDPSAAKYVVASALGGGSFDINAPGLRGAIVDGKAVSLNANYDANMAFSKSAVHLLTRLPQMPEGGDQADDVIVVQDPVSGIFFQVAMYKAYRAVLIEVAVAWGVKAAKPEHMALLID